MTCPPRPDWKPRLGRSPAPPDPPWLAAELVCETSGCDPAHVRVGDALIRQCARCRRVLAVITRATGPGHTRWVAQIQPTDDRPADDWDGCLD